jgi:hypothetical protein
MEDARTERVVTVAVIVLAAIIGTALVSGGPRRARGAVAGATTPTTVAAATVTTVGAPSNPVSTVTAATSTTVAVAGDPGTLPQTTDEPVASGAAFDAGTRGLWDAIVHDDPELAKPFFFPKSAYVQVKAIADPATDYEQRLVANFAQDIHTLHTQLGSAASTAQFNGIQVPENQAVLVQPGEESNKLPYWRVYGSTLQYTIDGGARTFPVTSLISWRGEWYVVHLGEIR